MTGDNLPLAGSVALITGATGGIGSVITRRLAQAGATVIINHLDAPDLAHDLCEQLHHHGAHAIAIQADVRDPAQVEQLRNHAERTLGPPDTIVSAAGAYPRIPWDQLDPQRWNDMLETNLTSHYLVTHAFTPAMRMRRRGRIIALGSVLAHIGRHDLAAYITAKAGVEGLIRALARELGPDNITANCIAPGSIHVDAEQNVVTDPAAMRQRQLDRQCIKRRGTPADIAEAVTFLAQPAAGFITGQTLHIDGGWFLA